jgi:hypothetical protein
MGTVRDEAWFDAIWVTSRGPVDYYGNQVYFEDTFWARLDSSGHFRSVMVGGGLGGDHGRGVAIDSRRAVYVGGMTAGAADFGDDTLGEGLFVWKPCDGNRAPIAQCQDVVMDANAQCRACGSVDNGSYDPDGPPWTLTAEPECDFALGDHQVLLTISDDAGATDSCTGTVSVQDQTLPTLSCQAPPTITPPDAPISFQAMAADNCSVQSVAVSTATCWRTNPAGKTVYDVCELVVSGDTITVVDSGGIGAVIQWQVVARDGSGNEAIVECSTEVVGPA